MAERDFSVEQAPDGAFRLRGHHCTAPAVVNQYLSYLADRNYSPRTQRSYAFDLLHFVRFLSEGGLGVSDVDTDTILRYLASCRTAVVRGRPGPNVISIRDRRSAGYSPATINRRLAAISGLFAFRQLRDPKAANPLPRGGEARRVHRGEQMGMLGHLARPRPRSRLRVKEPRRLPRGLSVRESKALLSSFRSWRDRAIAGLMLTSGLRSAEVLSLRVADVDVGRGWARVVGKGDKERRVPLDPDVTGAIQTYLLAERPATDAEVLFVVGKGPRRGEPLSAEGLRALFRYHRARSGVGAGHPHALRHSFGTALAEAGVDLPVIQALMGHEHIDSSAAYIHLAPETVRAAYEAAKTHAR